MSRRIKFIPGQLSLSFGEEDRMTESVDVKPTTEPDGRRPKTTPKKTMEQRFEEQKKALQSMTQLVIQRGCTSGLKDFEVKQLMEALVALGWIPKEHAP